MHVIGQQLDRIEEKITERIVSVEKPVSKISISVKTEKPLIAEKPLIDLLSQREKVMFKISQSKTLEVVEKMLFDLKVKTEGTSRSTACTISRNGKEIVSNENIDSNTVSSVSTKNIFDDDLPEIKKFVGNPKPMSFTKNWYPRPTPPDMQSEERVFQTQFSVSADKFYEWNIDGLSEHEIINNMSHMSMVSIAIKITMISIKLKLLIYLLLVFLVLFVDSGIHISQKNPKILLKMLLKRMMKVFLFLMKVLVAVF